jgi:septin family protein
MSSINNKSSRPFTVIVEGNIGSGKTTFLNHFERFPGVVSLAEPVNLWRNAKGHNLLVRHIFTHYMMFLLLKEYQSYKNLLYIIIS